MENSQLEQCISIFNKATAIVWLRLAQVEDLDNNEQKEAAINQATDDLVKLGISENIAIMTIKAIMFKNELWKVKERL